MVHNNHRYACMVEGILFGASVGVATGLLFAPRAEKVIKKAGSFYSDAHEKTEEILGHAAKSAESKLNRIKEVLGRD